MKFFLPAFLVLASYAFAAPFDTSTEHVRRQDVNCEECAQLCNDPSNGNALGAACLLVKCGAQVRQCSGAGVVPRS